MPDSHVVDSDDSDVKVSLPDRLDAAIGETSSGIGVMMSELVRRSLRTGVADIERALLEIATDKVDVAIETQLPVVSETANRVAESTSARVVKSAIGESEQRTQQDLRAAVSDVERKTETEIRSAVTEVQQQTQEELRAAVTGVNESLRQQKEEIAEKDAETNEELTRLNSRAQSSWKKVKNHFDIVDAAFQKTEQKIQHLSEAGQSNLTRLEQLAEEKGLLESRLEEASTALSALERSRQQQQQTLELLMEQNEQLQGRISELEKPKGLKAVWQKIRKPKDSKGRLPSSDDDLEIDTDE